MKKDNETALKTQVSLLKLDSNGLTFGKNTSYDDDFIGGPCGDGVDLWNINIGGCQFDNVNVCGQFTLDFTGCRMLTKFILLKMEMEVLEVLIQDLRFGILEIQMIIQPKVEEAYP